MINSNEVWVVEYFSSRCGSCKDFAPKWEEAAERLQKEARVNVAGFNIDEKPNMKHAEKSGYLSAGIPSVRVFTKHGDSKGVEIDTDVGTIPADELYSKVLEVLSGREKNDKGKFLKQK
eukprot:CAMPEP_0175844372 /NCGR_PEP_ID=MMETSP0107_2-20121207/21608_1 /TAXON_ID=195067 ORGANISM="Goniomonas pacifica, Strain CCMP1869" /NCGR_SAMPLE_ID=MMETSP0107_2 /ASSEMBLY_ACC=CAM_ASM_000203 /LENGTH=118 /DNA_ID=CAMNT_0017158763 /DNA_START=96 /DNA_END=452 /DNA_ORIENTATION=+